MFQQIKEPDEYSTVLFKCGRYDLIEFYEKLKILEHKVEIRSVVDELRDLNVYYLNQVSYDEQLRELTDNGLMFLPLARIKLFEGFGHKHEITDEIGVNTSVYGVISRDNSKLKKFKEYYDSGDDYNMGLLLGYPECCCRAYVDYSRRFSDPVYEIAQNSLPLEENNRLSLRDVPWNLQIHMRYFGFKIIPFFPCNYRCEEAKLFAEKWYDLMCSIDLQTAKKLKELMLEQSSWSLYNSQAIINLPPSKGNFMGYVISSYDPQKKEVDFYPI